MGHSRHAYTCAATVRAPAQARRLPAATSGWNMGKVGRRRFLIASGALLAVPTRAISLEPEKVWRIGYVHLRAGPSERDEAFRAELRRLGYVEGRNLAIADRWTSGALDRLPEIAAEFVRLKVDAIVASSRQATEAARRATS